MDALQVSSSFSFLPWYGPCFILAESVSLAPTHSAYSENTWHMLGGSGQTEFLGHPTNCWLEGWVNWQPGRIQKSGWKDLFRIPEA